jgi:hypothetical protein
LFDAGVPQSVIQTNCYFVDVNPVIMLGGYAWLAAGRLLFQAGSINLNLVDRTGLDRTNNVRTISILQALYLSHTNKYRF